MPVVAFFEGELITDPQLGMDEDGTPACTAVVRPFPRSEKQRAQWDAAGDPPVYRLKAREEQVGALATLVAGTNVVIIGHVKAEASTGEDGRRRWQHTVIVDSLGETVRAPVLAMKLA